LAGTSELSRLRWSSLAELLGFGVATWVIGILAMKLSWADLRYRGAGNGGKGFVVGLGVGAAPALAAMAIAAPTGNAGWALDGGTFVEWLSAVSGLAVLLLPAAFAEEVLFRGVGYVALSKAFGRLGPAIVLSLLFGAAHLGNPNVTNLAVANVALAGVFLSAAFWLPGGMWAATGVHLGWNLTLAAFGAPVSGIPFTLPMLDYATGGPQWLTGGNFGPEGGIIATLIIGIASVWLFRRTTPRVRSGQAPEAPSTT
ncbi:MAG TPA: CPBP family intramembrane glutamic endopeptidase, partial [Gemmatimonadales bacterium]